MSQHNMLNAQCSPTESKSAECTHSHSRPVPFRCESKQTWTSRAYHLSSTPYPLPFSTHNVLSSSLHFVNRYILWFDALFPVKRPISALESSPNWLPPSDVLQIWNWTNSEIEVWFQSHSDSVSAANSTVSETPHLRTCTVALKRRHILDHKESSLNTNRRLTSIRPLCAHSVVAAVCYSRNEPMNDVSIWNFDSFSRSSICWWIGRQSNPQIYCFEIPLFVGQPPLYIL